MDNPVKLKDWLKKHPELLYMAIREDDSGNRYLVASGLSEQGARAKIRSLLEGQKKGHKQLYGVVSYQRGKRQEAINEHNILV